MYVYGIPWTNKTSSYFFCFNEGAIFLVLHIQRFWVLIKQILVYDWGDFTSTKEPEEAGENTVVELTQAINMTSPQF
jgi:hypothetical protein